MQRMGGSGPSTQFAMVARLNSQALLGSEAAGEARIWQYDWGFGSPLRHVSAARERRVQAEGPNGGTCDKLIGDLLQAREVNPSSVKGLKLVGPAKAMR
jgi:hypothetical protein